MLIKSNDEKLPELYAALAKAQGGFAPIAKNRSVTIQPKQDRETGYKPPAYTFRYADLEAIIAATRPALSANGLALVQLVTDEGGGAKLLTALLHTSGAALVSEYPIPKMGDRDPKQYGALLTYMRRYMVTPLLGVAADDDLDENGNHSDFEVADNKPAASAPKVTRKPKDEPAEAPPRESAPRTESTAQAGEFVGVGEIKFLENKARSVGVELSEILSSMGGLVAEAGKLTKADFDRVRADLVARG